MKNPILLAAVGVVMVISGILIIYTRASREQSVDRSICAVKGEVRIRTINGWNAAESRLLNE